MYTRERTGWGKHLDFMLIDLFCLVAAFLIGFTIRFRGSFSDNINEYIVLLAVFVLSQFAVSIIINNLSGVLTRGWMVELGSVIILTLGMTGTTVLIFFLTHSTGMFSRLMILYMMIAFVVFDLLGRKGWRWVLNNNPNFIKNQQTMHSLVIVTKPEYAEQVLESIGEVSKRLYNIRGFVFDKLDGVEYVAGIPVIGTTVTAIDYICKKWVDEILLCGMENNEELFSFYDACSQMGVVIHEMIPLQNVEKNKQFVEKIGGYTVVTTAFNYCSPFQAFFKRVIDIIGGIVGSILTIFLALIIGPIIFFQSPGHIFFTQDRIGKNGRVFKMVKFRSMYPDAEQKKAALLEQNRVKDGMMFKMEFDPRVIGNKILPDGTKKTGIGDFIRRKSLDEFPQFFNVLKGEMSLVGTRPPTQDEWEKYQYHHRSRLAIKPGVTGMWQISGRSDITDFEEVVRLDTEYICKYKTSLDIKILLKTIVGLFKGNGAM